MAHPIKHFRTITRHRHKVIANCARAGILRQGLIHDLSKYSPTEFIPGAKYFQGTRSPNEKERELYGYSQAWLHHKGRNRHHYEYWNDYNPKTKQIENVEAERSREIMTSIVDDRQKLSGFTEELKKAEEKDRLSHITAPIDGRVSRLDIHTVGGIVTPAQALMEIVPDEAVMQVEAWVENKDIGFVQPGQEAEVKVETFNFQKFGTIDANVVEVSPNAVEDKDKGRVYRVLMDFDKNSFNVNGKDVAISSGMTATGEIKIRKKRIIEFFLDPFRQYKSEALRER